MTLSSFWQVAFIRLFCVFIPNLMSAINWSETNMHLLLLPVKPDASLLNTLHLFSILSYLEQFHASVNTRCLLMTLQLYLS